MLSFEVKGIQELSQKANDIAQEISKSGNLVAKAALVIERQAKINASGRPGPKVRTGRLRASITTQLISPTQAKVGTNVVYAPFVEFGHQLRGNVWSSGVRYTGGSIFAMSNRMSPAYPFLGPTIQQTQGQIEGVVVEFGNNLEDIWNK